MVVNVTSFGRSGLQDWLWQRLSAVIIAAYVVGLTIFFCRHGAVDYVAWQGLFQQTFFRIASFLFLLGLVIHAWIGAWTVFTDYIKCVCLRLILQSALVITLITCLAWGIHILWG